MSKRAQQNQSAFNVGLQIGRKMAKKGKIDNSLFNMLFGNHYKGAKRFQSVARKAARIGYAAGLEKAAEAAHTKNLTTHLTGGEHAKL